MINEVSINKEQSENDDKSKKFDSLIRAYNEKGLFPFSLDNPTQNFSTKVSSPSKKIFNKQKFEFSSLKKDFSVNNWNYATFSGNKLPDFVYGYQNTHILESSGRKINFEYENNDKKEINMSGQKKIKQKLNNEFEGILLSKKREKEKEEYVNLEKNNFDKNKEKETYPITLTINDNFLDLLFKIYSNEGNEIGIKNENKNEGFSNKDNDNIKNNEINNNILKEKIPIINNNINNNLKNIIDEQISCICLKSQCLNNYCSCHKKGNICNKNCRCIRCKNNDNYINNISNSSNEINKKKNKCKCKCQNTNCISLYCDCKKRGILCSKFCLCNNCKNNKEL